MRVKDKLEDFQKTKDFLICVDSDGCVMDTMDAKHKEVFGPQTVNIWGLESIKDTVLKTWNDVNLYKKTRGINRFKGVVTTFRTLEAQGLNMPNITSLEKWTESTDELSNPSLERAIAETNDEQLKNALAWSVAVNRTIKEDLTGKDRPMEGAKTGLEEASKLANIAIVSSANGAAVLDEWTRHQLTTYVDVLLGQEAGSKAYCIEQLKNNNFDAELVLMVGDSPGDLDAAQKNDVLFYPIFAGKEKFSWERFKDEALEKFKNGSFRGTYQQQLITEFHDNLK